MHLYAYGVSLRKASVGHVRDGPGIIVIFKLTMQVLPHRPPDKDHADVVATACSCDSICFLIVQVQ